MPADQPLPVINQKSDDAALLARAFCLLLDPGRPVDPGELAAVLRRDPADVTTALGRLARAGRLRRNPAGQVVGSHGLSILPTRHELVIDGTRRWTWCAWDAVGILGALGASGQVHSTSPQSGAPIELTFDPGRAPASDVVVFLAADETRDSVVDNWCPLVNFFEHAKAAAAWASSHGVPGRALSLEEATATGTVAWQRWLGTRADQLEQTDAEQG